LMIVKNDGTSLYATRDLATDKFRLETYGRDVVIINEVGIEQSLYFKQLYEVEKMLGWFKDGQRIHIGHGHYRFKEGKMSTRKGNVIWLEDIIDEAIKRAYGISAGGSRGKIGLERPFSKHPEASERLLNIKPRPLNEVEKNLADIANDVAIGALKWNDLKRNYSQDIVFDWDDILNMQGNSGPYLQYTFARTQSVLGKWRVENGELRVENFDFHDDFTPEIEEEILLRTLIKFDDVLQSSSTNFAPNILCLYLFDLSQKYNLFYQKHAILNSKTESFRLALTFAVGKTLKEGLKLLGISAPEKM
ncbi:MAG TPA: arginine--tRNA ligase, partial [Candidatus Saccharimonadales bacterium]|nr:arginine--tRNA ligase [Candidatus Saccharimonadales bacterium]